MAKVRPPRLAVPEDWNRASRWIAADDVAALLDVSVGSIEAALRGLPQQRGRYRGDTLVRWLHRFVAREPPISKRNLP